MEPVISAADALAQTIGRIDAHIEAERADPTVDPRCLSSLVHHGKPTERAIVLFHGFTNCPRQFRELGAVFFAAGFNVYIPRLPRHGLRDKMTSALAGLTAAELTACAHESAVLAAGLGARVTVLGLSVGATVVAWLAQTHALDRAIAVAPFFSVVRVPTFVEPFIAGALAHAPDLELWWDPRVKEHAEPDHAYPRFSTHALAECLQLGETVRDAARESAPLTPHATLVLNTKDPAIDNAAARDVWALWRDRGAVTAEFEFTDLDTRHDIIEPVTYPQAATLVYPVLLRLAAA